MVGKRCRQYADNDGQWPPPESRRQNHGEKLGLVADLGDGDHAGGNEGCGEHLGACLTGRKGATYGSSTAPSGRVRRCRHHRSRTAGGADRRTMTRRSSMLMRRDPVFRVGYSPMSAADITAPLPRSALRPGAAVLAGERREVLL